MNSIAHQFHSTFQFSSQVPLQIYAVPGGCIAPGRCLVYTQHCICKDR